jgi:hypothetical protein
VEQVAVTFRECRNTGRRGHHECHELRLQALCHRVRVGTGCRVRDLLLALNSERSALVAYFVRCLSRCHVL